MLASYCKTGTVFRNHPQLTTTKTRNRCSHGEENLTHSWDLLNLKMETTEEERSALEIKWWRFSCRIPLYSNWNHFRPRVALQAPAPVSLLLSLPYALFWDFFRLLTSGIEDKGKPLPRNQWHYYQEKMAQVSRQLWMRRLPGCPEQLSLGRKPKKVHAVGPYISPRWTWRTSSFSGPDSAGSC